MSFPRYGSYCDSGVQWLGEVPGHWRVKKIGHLSDLIAGFAFPSEGFSFDEGAGIPLVRGDNVSEGYLRWGDKGRYWPQGAAFDNRYLLAENDIVIQMDGSKVGKNWAIVSSSDLPLLLVQRVTRVRVREALPRFVFLLIANDFFVRYVDRAKTDPAIPHITMRNIADYWVPLPPPSEQAAITAFLDRETAKIDALVVEQQRLIELLKEKRQAVISRAVTKGLDPNAPMKDSGLEWLGEVPEHWEVRRISSLSTKITNGYVGPTRDVLMDEGVRYLQSLHIKDNRIRFNAPYYVREDWSKEHSKSILETGDVLIVQTGDIGQVAVVTEEYAGCNCHALIIVSPIRSVVRGDWIAWVLNADYGFHSLLSIQTGALHPHLNCGNVKDLFIPVPPISEQWEITDFVSARLEEFEQLVTEAGKAIALLRERRSALISAAVTGKIDVRGLIEGDAPLPDVVAA